jgi:hypothetical protein
VSDPPYDHKHNVCTRKVRYRTLESANTHVARKRGLRRHRGRHIRDMQAYACQYCGGYHVGHTLGERPAHVPMRVLRREWAELRARFQLSRKAKTWRGNR